MKKNSVTTKSLTAWVLTTSLKLQAALIIVIVVAVCTRVIPLEMQKRIVNEAIGLRQLDLLLRYCAIYFGAFLTSNILKFWINWFQTVIAQSATATMRNALYQRLLALPPAFFNKTQPGLVVSSLVTELATAGDFVGTAIAVPITNLLTLIAFGAYLFWLNPLLGAVSLAVYPLVLILIPFLQRRANEANAMRLEATRSISDRVVETVGGIQEIHVNGAHAIEGARFERMTDELSGIRVRWNLYRSGIKVLNNLFSGLSPLLIFILGGYLTIMGQLELGALVAFLSAQEKLYDPWRELIDFYQGYQEAKTVYYRTMDYFEGAIPSATAPTDREIFKLEPSIDIEGLSVLSEDGTRLVSDVSLSVAPGEQVALVGFSGSGKSLLTKCMTQLQPYSAGRATIGGREIRELTKRDIACNLAMVQQVPYIFSGTIEANLTYGHIAQLPPESVTPNATVVPPLDDLVATLQAVGLFNDVLRLGMTTLLPQQQVERVAASVIGMRKDFYRKFGRELENNIEFFQENQFINHACLATNILYGVPADATYKPANLSRNPAFVNFLSDSGLEPPFMRLGADLICRTADVLGKLKPDPMFYQHTPFEVPDIDAVMATERRLTGSSPGELLPEDKELLLRGALLFRPGLHTLAAISDTLKTQILDARRRFQTKLVKLSPGAVAFFNPDRYAASQSLLNNIIFGKVTSDLPQVQEQITERIVQLLIENDMLEAVVSLGMQFEVGTRGERLSGGQRQKLSIARALLKQPRLLILDEATSALDNKSQARIQNLLANRLKGKTTVVSVVHRLDTLKGYDRIAVMKAGQILELGSYDALMSTHGQLYSLVKGKL